MDIPKPIVDAEKLVPGELSQWYRDPPDLPAPLNRSSLLVGARGAGKTMILKRLAADDAANSIYIDLLDELGTLVRENPTLDQHTGEAEEIATTAGQSECLVALAILRELHDRGILLASATLKRALPPRLVSTSPSEFPDWIRDATAMVFERVLEPRDCLGALHRALTEAGTMLGRLGRRLRVLFDRADMIHAPAIRPVVGLLDQAGPYIVVLATRPAPNSDPDWGINPPVIPGDHYPVIPMGASPRSKEWREFVQVAIEAQFGEVLRDTHLPKRVLESIIYFSRDSLRLALELTYTTLKEGHKDWTDRLSTALASHRLTLIERTHASMRRWSRSFARLADTWREHILGDRRILAIRAPVQVNVDTVRAQSSFDLPVAPQALDRFIAAGLSVGTLAPPQGESWFPGKRLDTLEIHPLLLWRDADPTEVPAPNPILHVTMNPSTFTGSHPPRRGGKVFVGYRFREPLSQQFYNHLKLAVETHPLLTKVSVVDGRLPTGAEWASRIRERIRGARLGAVCDVTGARGDLIFELGLAYGLRRSTLPVVATKIDRDDCPDWLQDFNVGTYENQMAVLGIVNSIHQHIVNRAELRPPAPPDLVPYLVGAIGIFDWNSYLVERARTIALNNGLKWDYQTRVDGHNYQEAIRLANSAMLLILSLDGTLANDSFAHFVAGMAVSRHEKQSARGVLARRVLVLTRDNSVDIPESILRCQTIITCCQNDTELVSCVTEFVEAHNAWVTRG